MDPLRKKFEEIELNLPECQYSYIGEDATTDCVEITKDFAKNFGEWMTSGVEFLDDTENGKVYLYKHNRYTTEELIQIFIDNHYDK